MVSGNSHVNMVEDKVGAKDEPSLHRSDDHTSETSSDDQGLQGWDVSKYLFSRDCLDRKLKRHHITGIAFSGTIGIGLFVTSGELIAISGSAGCVISFVCAGMIVIGVMRSLAELVSVRPVSGALMDYPHTFVDPALGFAVGASYCLAQCVSMATLTAAAARAADDFVVPLGLQEGQKAGVIVGLCMTTLFSNICGVKLYGRLERMVKWLKLLLMIGLCVLMILIAAGVSRNGLTVNQKNQSTYANKPIVPYLRWLGFSREADQIYGGIDTGIEGQLGQLLAIWTTITLAMFACMGGDIVIVAAGEAESPRRDLPAAARFMYMAPIGFYILGSFLVGFNVDYSDPALYHTWTASNLPGPHSPFIIAVQKTTIPILPGFLNGCFLFSAYTAANTGLFSASRTLFAFARTYGNDFLRNTVGRTNSGHTPVMAIIVCSTFGLLAFLGIDTKSPNFNQAILTLSAYFTSAIACVYGAECIAFLRFKKGLTHMEKNLTFSRDSEEYRRRFYRAHWQPLCAIVGLAGCTLIVVFSGWSAIYLFRFNSVQLPNGDLKPTSLLIADVIGAYSGTIVFFSLYIGYKVTQRTRFQTLSDFEDEYFPADFTGSRTEKTAKQERKVGHVLREAWSLIK